MLLKTVGVVLGGRERIDIYIINGKFLTRKITGVERYAREIVAELDSLVDSGQLEVLVPRKTRNLPWYKNINIVEAGKLSGVLWEQLVLPFYAMKKRAVIISLCNAAPLIKPDIVCIHDMNVRVNPQFYSKKFVLWYNILFWWITKKAKRVLTVSDFSKREIQKYYKIHAEKIAVIRNAWQHMMRIQPDTGIFEKFSVLKEKPYFFTMSSMARNKNHAWLTRVARKNLSYTFAIAGNINERIFGNTHIQTAENVLLLGYVSDEEAKALMQRCEAFIFPTFYEGFGIPPMEAISCGARAIVSNASCMPEIYSDSVYYIDPWHDNVDLSRVLKVQIGSAQKLLDNYSWEKSAQQLKSILKSMERSDSDLPVFY